MNRHGFAVLFALAAMAVSTLPVPAQTPPASAQERYAQSTRPRIIIHPRRLGPNAKRYCRTQLVQEFRVSGTVIVPHTTCWWR